MLASWEVLGTAACDAAGVVATWYLPSTGQVVPKVPGWCEFALPPCCVGPRRMFVLFGVVGGWAVEPATVIAVEGGP